MGFGAVIEKAVCLGLALSAFLSGKAGCKCSLDDVSLPTALTRQGAVRGFEDSHGNHVYLGIPFAATTAGKNRFAPSYTRLFVVI